MEELQKKLQALLDQAIADGETFSGTLLVCKEGVGTAFAMSGVLDPRTGAPVTRDAIYRLYSQSKPITAAAVMLLMERGQLDLHAPVSRYLPGFRNARVLTPDGLVPAKTEPTIDNLLSMTAGCCYPGEWDEAGKYAAALFDENTKLMAEGRGMGTVEFCNRMGQLPLAFHPGTEFRYSTCADILGAVVEVVSGMRFGDFLQKEFFEPLGMKDTAFYVPPEKKHRLAVTCHRFADRPNEVWEGTHLCCSVATERPAFESGGAGLYSTADDYLAFSRMLLNGGMHEGRQILSKATVRHMTQAQLTEEQAKLTCTWFHYTGFGYGKLMRVCLRPGAVPGIASMGEYGWDGWLNTYFANLPEEKITMVYLTSLLNEGPDMGLRRKIRNLSIAYLSDR